MKIIQSNRAQSVLEYTLMLAAVVGTLVVAFSPNGIMTKTTESSLNSSLECLRMMSECVRYDANGDPEPPVCGNGCCEPGENEVGGCVSDCKGCGGMGAQIVAQCGDGRCEGGTIINGRLTPETCSSCSSDCGQCEGESCGDGSCDPNSETCATCPSDCPCPVVCGDGVCELSENCQTCGQPGEDCECGAGEVCLGSGICCIPKCPTNRCGPAEADPFCGQTLDCTGNCKAGKICFNGACCTPKKCANRECGVGIPDGCGGTFDCDCNAPYSCVDGNCECIVFSCQTGWCGLHQDTCGGQTDCGQCPAGQFCTAPVDGICCDIPDCTGRCGQFPDGCTGAMYNCPCNTANKECCTQDVAQTSCASVAGGGTPDGVCCAQDFVAADCPPNPKQLGDACGTFTNSCGVVISCGGCGQMKTCDPGTHTCVPSCPNGTCEATKGENCTTCAADCGCPAPAVCSPSTNTCCYNSCPPLVCTPPGVTLPRCGGGTLSCTNCPGAYLCNPATQTCESTCGTPGHTACEAVYGENCETCFNDCRTPATEHRHGDCYCDWTQPGFFPINETCRNSPLDCFCPGGQFCAAAAFPYPQNAQGCCTPTLSHTCGVPDARECGQWFPTGCGVAWDCGNCEAYPGTVCGANNQIAHCSIPCITPPADPYIVPGTCWLIAIACQDWGQVGFIRSVNCAGAEECVNGSCMPQVCNSNGICEPGIRENCGTCNDCPPAIYCTGCNNNGFCEDSAGEGCGSCPGDCFCPSGTSCGVGAANACGVIRP